MSYFEKIRKLLNIQDLTTRRLEQLEKEQKFDRCLESAHKDCPVLIAQYLLKTREINRKYAKETYTTSVLEYPEKAAQNLDVIDKMYEKYTPECPLKICQQLPELLRDMENL